MSRWPCSSVPKNPGPTAPRSPAYASNDGFAELQPWQLSGLFDGDHGSVEPAHTGPNASCRSAVRFTDVSIIAVPSAPTVGAATRPSVRTTGPRVRSKSSATSPLYERYSWYVPARPADVAALLQARP